MVGGWAELECLLRKNTSRTTYSIWVRIYRGYQIILKIIITRNYKDAAVIIKQAGAVVHNMSAVVVYLAEVNEVTHLEVAQYTIEQFLSDVGGAAGLFMGMSLATVLGTCDFIFLMIYESVQRTLFYKRIRDIESRLTTGSRTGIIGQKRL